MARSSPSAGLHAMQGLHGVAADFTRVLLALPAQKARFADLAAEMEEELAGGRISVAYGPEKTVTDIKYDGTPMRSASSSASEMAPLVLYLKHVLDAGDVLIIEEPEAGLHPASQRTLARFLARLVRRGLNIVMTTHSPFMLEQLSHLVQASALEAGARDLGSGDDYLCAGDVAAYAFESGRDGSSITPIRISETDGIPQEEFVRVDEAMYDELMRIESRAS